MRSKDQLGYSGPQDKQSSDAGSGSSGGISSGRRTFLKQGAAALGGLVVGFTIPAGKRLAHAAAEAAGVSFAPNAFLRVGTDDSVTVLLAHSEMGQGVWTALPTANNTPAASSLRSAGVSMGATLLERSL